MSWAASHTSDVLCVIPPIRYCGGRYCFNRHFSVCLWADNSTRRLWTGKELKLIKVKCGRLVLEFGLRLGLGLGLGHLLLAGGMQRYTLCWVPLFFKWLHLTVWQTHHRSRHVVILLTINSTDTFYMFSLQLVLIAPDICCKFMTTSSLSSRFLFSTKMSRKIYTKCET